MLNCSEVKEILHKNYVKLLLLISNLPVWTFLYSIEITGTEKPVIRKESKIS